MASGEDPVAIVAELRARLEASGREIARERAAREAAEEAREASGREIARERAAREAAEEAREAAEKAREASEKARFLEWMRSISSSSSGDTTSNADEGRRGAPLPTAASLSDVVGPSFAAGGAAAKVSASAGGPVFSAVTRVAPAADGPQARRNPRRAANHRGRARLAHAVRAAAPTLWLRTTSHPPRFAQTLACRTPATRQRRRSARCWWLR